MTDADDTEGDAREAAASTPEVDRAPSAPPLAPPSLVAPVPAAIPVETGLPAWTAPLESQLPPVQPRNPAAGQALLPVDPSTMRLPVPLDADLDGEVIEAELVGLDTPEGEGPAIPGIQTPFAHPEPTDFAATSGGGAVPPKLARWLVVLLWVAGSIAAILLLIALFLLGTRIPAALAPTPTPTPTPSITPTPTPTALPAGPIEPGTHRWNALLGGECLDPFESAWQDEYTVVDCAVPHPAQLVVRATFADAPDAAYPGVEELTKRMNLLCTAPTIIDYSIAGALTDIQVQASFAVDAAEWDDGDRTYFCFLNRGSGENFTSSIALPQPAAQ